MARLNIDTDTDGGFQIDDLYYRFPIGGNSNIYIVAAESEFYDGIETLSIFESEPRGALSRFTRFNPIYRLQENGTGVIANLGFSSKAGLSLGYLTDTDDATTVGTGVTDGGFQVIAQLTFEPSENVGLGLTYVRSYFPDGTNVSGSTSSALADNPFGAVPTTANSFAGQMPAAWVLANVSGWAGYAIADAENTTDNQANLLNCRDIRLPRPG